MSTKTYTAEAIRHTAENLEWNRAHGMEAIKIASEHVIDQLRYAAAMVDRCDRQKSHLDGLLEFKDHELVGVTLRQLINNEKSIVDYILHGDAGNDNENK